MASLDDLERAALRGRSIGFVFQTFNLLGHRTAIENVMLAEVYGGGEREGRRERALARSSESEWRTRRDTCRRGCRAASSSAWRSRGRCWARPRLLLCDEPTGNLDSATPSRCSLLFEDSRRQGLTLMVVTHDEDVAARAERIVRMVDGRLTEEER